MNISDKNHNKLQEQDDQMLNSLQKDSLGFFISETNDTTGLTADKNDGNSPASISVTGMALTCYIIAVENNMITRSDAIFRTLKPLRFIYSSIQGKEKDATGYKGFYYHFLDMKTGKRVWNCELSTIDTALFIAGALSVAAYFKGDNDDEKEIRQIAEELYKRIDWQWALNRGNTLTHGWKPGRGFLSYRWDENYSEALLLYVLATVSPTFPIPAEAYQTWTDSFTLTDVYNIRYLYAGPLFIHQFSHIWIDFKGIYDAFNKRAGFDYFENSCRATKVHQAYAIENPNQIDHYGAKCWGLTASDGPGRKTLKIKGRKRSFYGYKARGAPFGPDDGTVSPWSMVASLPFEPDIVLESMHYAIENLQLRPENDHGFDASFNSLYPEKSKNPYGWVSPHIFGLNQAPVVLMIENYQTGLVWELMKRCPYIREGLKKTGFTGGWLDEEI